MYELYVNISTQNFWNNGVWKPTKKNMQNMNVGSRERAHLIN